MSKELAIVIPYYKIKFFKETLRSLGNQTDKRFNVYIGNDNSPECPKGIIDEFDGEVSIYYKRFDNNLGGQSLPKQWDRCINLIKDETWVMVLGDDDMLENNVVESWYNEKEDLINLYKFSTQMYFMDEHKYSFTYSHPEYENSLEAFYRKFKGQTRSSLSEYIFKKSVYKKIGFKNYPLGWYSDDRAWLDFSNNKKIKTINGAKIIIRVSGLSISGKRNNLTEKNNATIQFYKDLCTDYIKGLSIEKRGELIGFMEKLIVDNNLMTTSYMYFLLKLYYKNLSLEQFFQFVKRRRNFLKMILKKDK